jgi:predicted ATP-binding protein involved in virulence
MIITRLEIENFRTLKSVAIVPDPKANVLAGVNGAGKSTLINAVHLMFGRYISAMRTGRIVGRGPILQELRTGADKVHLAIKVEDEGRTYSWYIDRRFKGLHTRVTDQDLDGIRRLSGERLKALEHPDTANIPLFTTYPVGRAVLDIPLRIRSKDATTQSAAFQSTALDTGRNFRSFFAWFRDREDYENERRIENHRFRDRETTAVRRAIETLLPGFSNLRIRRKPLSIVVTKGGVEFDVDMLSDGEKGLLGLVGDLARRLSLANPALKNPNEGQGIVLIDEIELHLHPAWQRNAVRGLQRTFPNIQFIFTTHSPQVISELRPNQTFLLVDGVALPAERSYGMDSTAVLRELMNDPGRPSTVNDDINALYTAGRPSTVNDDINALYTAIDAGDVVEGERRLTQLEMDVGREDPELGVARSRIRRTKVLRARETH